MLRTSLFSLCVILFGCSVLGMAQTSSGTIRGTLTDPSGATIPDARVSITNTATNVTQESRTNDQGLYVVPFLPPGHYTVSVEKPGFQTTRHTDILLQVADDLTINMQLQVGGTSSQVVVESTAPLVNTNNASLGQVIENRRIVELPLDGREPISLAGLAPGVVPVPPNTNIIRAEPSLVSMALPTSRVKSRLTVSLILPLATLPSIAS